MCLELLWRNHWMRREQRADLEGMKEENKAMEGWGQRRTVQIVRPWHSTTLSDSGVQSVGFWNREGLDVLELRKLSNRGEDGKKSHQPGVWCHWCGGKEGAELDPGASEGSLCMLEEGSLWYQPVRKGREAEIKDYISRCGRRRSMHSFSYMESAENDIFSVSQSMW